MTTDWEAVTKNWQRQARQFFADYKRVLDASKWVAVFLFATSTFLGLFPILGLSVLGSLVDALIGARGVGVWTSDVQKFLWYQIILLLAFIPALVFIGQLKGIVLRLSRSTKELALIASSFLIGLQAAPVTVGVLVLFVIAFAFVKHPKVQWIMSSIMILLAIQPLWTLANSVVEKDILVGQMISWGGALLIFTAWMALRPYKLIPRA
ncbi:hypothetical protein IH979_03120 [Patescibacteria group bacterium]|nr:hypothetical protein [Patescibacteria group bacterium]